MRLARVVALAGLAFVLVPIAGAAAPGTGRIYFSANDAPRFTGHIYVVPSGGKPVDLSASSGGFDSSPAVSSDGRHVAFVSTRTGRPAIYTMAIDGSDVARVSPFLPAANGTQATIAWRPGTQSFAIETPYGNTNGIYLGTLGGGWRVLVASTPSAGLVGWSPDGRYLAHDAVGGPAAVDVNGKQHFRLPGEAAGWSASGRFAVELDESTDVYSEAGRRLGAIAGGASFAWSPDGKRLATLSAKGVLQIRAGGVGKPTESRKLAGHNLSEVQWLGETHVRVEGADGWLSVDLRTGKEFILPGAFSSSDSVLSLDGTHAAGTDFVSNGGSGLTRLRLATLTSQKTIATDTMCFDDDGPSIEDLAFFAGGGLVYETDCSLPPADVYAVAPDGTGLDQLTDTPTDEEQVSVSPDGSRLAFVEGVAASCHAGCAETIETMNTDGSGGADIVSPTEARPYDDSPSFSPDGRTILFVRSGYASDDLDTVPVAGGALHGLGVEGELPAWGPTQIAFDGQPNNAVTVADPDGRNATVVATPPGDLLDVPAWSADGRLAVLQQRGSALSILVVATGKRIALPRFTPTWTGGALSAGGLAWSPDGTEFAFTAATPTDPHGDVWTIGADGAQLTQVTHGLGAVSSLSWR